MPEAGLEDEVADYPNTVTVIMLEECCEAIRDSSLVYLPQPHAMMTSVNAASRFKPLSGINGYDATRSSM